MSVCNIPRECSDEELRGLFHSAVRVENMYIANPTGGVGAGGVITTERSATVVVGTRRDSARTIELFDGYLLHGKPLVTRAMGTTEAQPPSVWVPVKPPVKSAVFGL